MRLELMLAFSIKIHYAVPTGIIPIGYNPMNQTPFKGKIPHTLNPIKFPRRSYKSKEALQISMIQTMKIEKLMVSFSYFCKGLLYNGTCQRIKIQMEPNILLKFVLQKSCVFAWKQFL
jgi:hypothetical protein